MTQPSRSRVYVETVSINNERQISGGSRTVRDLSLYANEITDTIAATSSLVRDAIPSPPDHDGDFDLTEFTVKFGVALGVEGSAVVVKSNMTATLEIEMKFTQSH